MVAVEELVREIARALVDEPAAVDVQSVNREENTVLKLKVAPNDVGKLLAIDIETGEYEIAANDIKAGDKLLARLPEAQI